MRAALEDPLTLRWRTPEDSAVLGRLAVEAFAEYSPDGAERTVLLLERLETLVACRAAGPVGLAAIELVRPGVLAIQALAVTERERGRGIGRKLLEAVEGVARDRRIRFLSLHTAEANVAALALFVKSGFQVERRIPRYYRGVFDACEMVKILRLNRRTR